MTELKDIKQLFFTFRNGVVADVFRQANAPYKTIFGLQVPQLGEIARGVDGTPEEKDSLAACLWEDSGVRESRLLACWLFNPATTDAARAAALAEQCATREEADILCWRLLRRMESEELRSLLSKSGSEGAKMCLERLD